MGLAINYVLLGISFVALAIAGGFSTNSSIRTTQIPGYKQNEKLINAHKYLSIAAAVCWVTVALLIFGIIAMIFFSAELAEISVTTGSSTGKYILYGLLFLSLGATIAIGILTAIAANDIGQSKVTNDNLSRRQAIIGASIAIGVFVLLVIALIVLFTYKPKAKETPDSLFTDLEEI